MFAPDPSAQPTAQPQPAGEPFVVGRFSGVPVDPDATVAMPAVEPASPALPAQPVRRRGRKALIAFGLLGALAAGALGANALADGPVVATASGPIGTDLAGALPDGESAAGAAPVTDAPSTTAAPAPSTTAPAPTTPPAPQPTTPQPTTPPAAPLPAVVSVSGPTSVICSDGMSKSITISWVVEHADEVVLSIDGPGAYQSYPGTDGSDSVPFACDGAQHTYTVAAKADGHTASKTITVSPLYLDPMPELVAEVDLPGPIGD